MDTSQVIYGQKGHLCERVVRSPGGARSAQPGDKHIRISAPGFAALTRATCEVIYGEKVIYENAPRAARPVTRMKREAGRSVD
jgi:hypothetical protein